MSLYNIVFGENPLGEALLATLGLKPETVGRYRDCFVSGGEIAVYTRNGGGNRSCVCEYEPKYGTPDCKHHTSQSEEDEYTKSGLIEKTGRREIVTWYHCEEPNSEACGCYGCVISYRLPKHPHYLCDLDDDFDSTYATIYFSFPAEFADELKRLDSGEKFDPSQAVARCDRSAQECANPGREDMTKKKTTKQKQFRQGDVLVDCVEGPLDDAAPVDRENGRIILAYGEVTTHAHAISEAHAAMFAKGAERFLRVEKRPAFLRHEEHSKIELPPGKYRVTRQREYRPGELPQNVAD